jgi:hypothetical protein
LAVGGLIGIQLLHFLQQLELPRQRVVNDCPDGAKRIADNALVAMTLLIAESRPAEKSVLISVVVNLINKRNQ